jgi:hypothetical protein
MAVNHIMRIATTDELSKCNTMQANERLKMNLKCEAYSQKSITSKWQVIFSSATTFTVFVLQRSVTRGALGPNYFCYHNIQNVEL